MNYNKSLSELLFEDHENNELVVERNKNDAAKKRAAKKGARRATRKKQIKARKALSKDNTPVIQIRGISSAAFLALPEIELQTFASMLFRPTANLKSRLEIYQKNAASLSGQQGGPESTDAGFTQIKNSIAKNADDKLYKSLEKSDNKLNTQVANLIQGTNTTLTNIGTVRFDFLNVGKEDKTKSQDRDIKMFDRLGHAFFTIVDPRTNKKVKIKNSKKEDQVIVFVLPIKKYLNKFQSDIYLTLFNSKKIDLDPSDKAQGVSNESSSLRFEGEMIHESSLSSLLFETNAASGTGEHSVLDLNLRIIDSAELESPLESPASDKANSLTNYASDVDEFIEKLNKLDKSNIAVISDGDTKLYYIKNKGFISDNSDDSKTLLNSVIDQSLKIKSNMTIDFIDAQSDEDLNKSLTRNHINDGTRLADFNSYYLTKTKENTLYVRFYSKKGLGYYIKLDPGEFRGFATGKIIDIDDVDKDLSLVLVTEKNTTDFYGEVDQPLADAIKEIFDGNLSEQDAKEKLNSVKPSPRNQAKSGEQSSQIDVQPIRNFMKSGNLESISKTLNKLNNDQKKQVTGELSVDEIADFLKSLEDTDLSQGFQTLDLALDKSQEVIKAANLSDAQTQELESLAKSKEEDVIERITQALKSESPLNATKELKSLSADQKNQVIAKLTPKELNDVLQKVDGENLTQRLKSLDITQDQVSNALQTAGHSTGDIRAALRDALGGEESEEQSGEPPEEPSQQDKSKALQGNINDVDTLFNADLFVSNMSNPDKPKTPAMIPVKIYLKKDNKIFTLETELYKADNTIKLKKISTKSGDVNIKELKRESFIYHQGLSLLIEEKDNLPDLPELAKSVTKNKFISFLKRKKYEFISAQIKDLEKYTKGSTVFNTADHLDKFDGNKTFSAKLNLLKLQLKPEDKNKLTGADSVKVTRDDQDLSITIVDDRGDVLADLESFDPAKSSRPLSADALNQIIQTAEFQSPPADGAQEKEKTEKAQEKEKTEKAQVQANTLQDTFDKHEIKGNLRSKVKITLRSDAQPDKTMDVEGRLGQRGSNQEKTIKFNQDYKIKEENQTDESFIYTQGLSLLVEEVSKDGKVITLKKGTPYTQSELENLITQSDYSFEKSEVEEPQEKKAPDFKNFEKNINHILSLFNKVDFKGLTYDNLDFKMYKELLENKKINTDHLKELKQNVVKNITNKEVIDYLLNVLEEVFGKEVKKVKDFSKNGVRELDKILKVKYETGLQRAGKIIDGQLNEGLVESVVTVVALAQLAKAIGAATMCAIPFISAYIMVNELPVFIKDIIEVFKDSAKGIGNWFKNSLSFLKGKKEEFVLKHLMSKIEDSFAKNPKVLEQVKEVMGDFIVEVFQLYLKEVHKVEVKKPEVTKVEEPKLEDFAEDANEVNELISLFTEKFKKSEGTDDINELTDRYDVTLDSMMNSIAAMVFQQRTQMAQQEASQIAYQARQDSMDASVLSGLAVMPALVGAAIAMPTLATGGTALLAAPIIASLFGSKMGDRSLRKNLRKGPQQIGLESDVKSGKDQIRKIILDISKDVLGVKEEPKEAEGPETAAESFIYRQGLSLLIEDIQDELIHNKGLSFLFEEEGDKEETSEDKKESKPETEEDTSHIRASINWATISKKLEAKNFFAYESTFKVGNPNLFSRVERELAVKLNALMSDCFGIKITDVEQLSLRASQAEALAGLIVDPNAKQGHGSINGAQPRGNTAKSRGDFLDIDSFTTLLNSMEGDVSKVIMYLLANGKLNSMFDAGGRSGQTVQEVMDVVVKTIKGEMDGMPSSIASDAEEAIRKLESNEWIDKLLKRSQYDSPIKVVHNETFTRDAGLALVKEIERTLLQFSNSFNRGNVGKLISNFNINRHGCIISKSWSGDDGIQKAYFKFMASDENARRAIYDKVVFYNEPDLKDRDDNFYIVIGIEQPIFDQIKTTAIKYSEDANKQIALVLATAIVIKSMRTSKATSYHSRVSLPDESRDFDGREFATSVMQSIMGQSPELLELSDDDLDPQKEKARASNKQNFKNIFKNFIKESSAGQESKETKETSSKAAGEDKSAQPFDTGDDPQGPQRSSRAGRDKFIKKLKKKSIRRKRRITRTKRSGRNESDRLELNKEDLFDAKKVHDDLLRLWKIR